MTSLELTIRAYDEATDREALSNIWFEASLLAHPFIGEARLREQRPLIETEYLPKAETWVACLGETPVGFISLLDRFIGGLFVAPGQQGHGIGRSLVAHAFTLKGELQLEVYTANRQATSFYEKLGFEEISRRAKDEQGLPHENAHLVLKR